MRNLISADFSRMWKNKVFWVGMASMLGLFLLSAFTKYREMIQLGEAYAMEIHTPIEEVVFENVPMVGFVSAVFVSLFLGAEYANGTMRNKISMGHRRLHIYFSNLIVCMTGLTMMLAFTLGVTACVSLVFFEPMEMSLTMALRITAASFLVNIAFAALCTLLVMSVCDRAVAGIACLILIIALMFAGSVIDGKLSQPPLIENYVRVDAQGKPTEVEAMENPVYLDGNARTAMLFLRDLTLTGQTYQISNMEAENPERMMVCSLAVIAAVTAIGIWIFGQKDIK